MSLTIVRRALVIGGVIPVSAVPPAAAQNVVDQSQRLAEGNLSCFPGRDAQSVTTIAATQSGIGIFAVARVRQIAAATGVVTTGRGAVFDL